MGTHGMLPGLFLCWCDVQNADGTLFTEALRFISEQSSPELPWQDACASAKREAGKSAVAFQVVLACPGCRFFSFPGISNGSPVRVRGLLLRALAHRAIRARRADHGSASSPDRRPRRHSSALHSQRPALHRRALQSGLQHRVRRRQAVSRLSGGEQVVVQALDVHTDVMAPASQRHPACLQHVERSAHARARPHHRRTAENLPRTAAPE
mmetsp:Transcript_28861/g.68390  ORF Transcript_28861/g.68390 Transcript_28861/m.68390 type:complete len:210 (-) Transcript_28861:85-714(-)